MKFVFLLLSLFVLSNAYKKKLSDFPSTVQNVVRGLTTKQKVGQMTQLDISVLGNIVNGDFVLNETLYNYTLDNFYIGSILNTPLAGARVPSISTLNVTQWQKLITRIQQIALERGSKLPIIFGVDSVHGANYIRGATLFPQQIGLAATFNRTNAIIQGSVTAKDTRACGIPWIFAPILDLAVEPLWPRVYETSGEDPYVVSEMGSSIIKGLQGFPAAISNPDKTCACMKHFVGYSTPRTGHDRAPSWIPERFLYQYFAPSFRAAIQAGVTTAMESYNDLNGIPVASSNQYLVKLLRDDMDFDGMLVTDYSEIKNLHDWHRIADTQKSAVQIAMQETSIDMSMVPFDTSFPTHLMELLDEGKIAIDRIDVSVARIIQLKMDLGLLNNSFPPSPDSEIVKSVGSLQDRNAAIQAARESIVLLENVNEFLPLDTLSSTTPKFKKIFLTGPSANSIRRLSGGWSIHWQGGDDDEYWDGVTIVQAFQNLLQNKSNVEVIYRMGVMVDGTYSQTDFDDAVNQTKNSDVAIVCIGEDAYAEKPGDIDDLHLPWGQQIFLRALINTGTPVVIVLLEGRARILNATLVSEAKAVLHGLLPGPLGGIPIAEILLGVTNPSGRLPYTYPRFTNNIHSPYWRTYSQQPYVPLWEFGTGLSYTTFRYSNLVVTPSVVASPQQTIQVSVTVTNTGKTGGSHSVLLYVQDLYRIITPEMKMLKRFEKAYFNPNDVVNFSFNLTVDDLAFYGLQNEKRTEDGVFNVTVGELSAAFQLSLGDNTVPTSSTSCDSSKCFMSSKLLFSLLSILFYSSGAVSTFVALYIYNSCKKSPGEYQHAKDEN